jgi:tRNA modification GTPase
MASPSALLAAWAARCVPRRTVASAAAAGARAYSIGAPSGVLPSADTIFALSSGAGRSAVAVVRLSGPGARGALAACTAGSDVPPPRRLAYRRIGRPGSGELIDMGMVVHFPGPASATGEDVAELHVHGSRAVVAALAAALAALPGLRPAAPGEFTRRAVAAGKLDLTAAEGLADLLDADTDAQRRQALRALAGDTGRLYDGWRDTLTAAAAHVEAAIDFVDDIETGEPGGVAGVLARVTASLAGVLDGMTAHLASARRAEVVRRGVAVGIFGAPNAGKSSLLNTLVRRPAAIVSAVPGTTRDVLEVTLDLGGLPVALADTAGLRHEAAAADDVEREGIRRALARVADSHLTLCVVDPATVPVGVAGSGTSGGGDPTSTAAATAELLLPGYGHLVTPDTILVVNKADPPDQGTGEDAAAAAAAMVDAAAGALARAFPHNTLLRVSCRHGVGIDALLATLEAAVQRRFGDGTDGPGGGDEGSRQPALMRERHRLHVEACVDSLRKVVEGGTGGGTSGGVGGDAPGTPLPLDVAAEELRLAIRHLGAITGRVDVEQVLDVLFASFCIGK